MKKLLSVSASKILMTCGLGMLLTIGAFWHHQVNQAQLDRLNVLNQGIGTCFNRISQTFTALMIRDLKSPYLNRGFMSLSDECLNETIKGINPFRQNVGKGYETLNKLISDVHWFHEKVSRVHTPLMNNKNSDQAPMNPISESFGNMENLKVNLVDEIDLANARLREVLFNDEVLMGAGLLIFVFCITLLALKEFERLQVRKEIEGKAINLLKSGTSNVSAFVDQLIEKSLVSHELNITAQVFRDYHEGVMERMTKRAPAVLEKETRIEVTSIETQADNENLINKASRTSFKEVLVSLQNINPKDAIHAAEIRDVHLAVNFESFEQLMNAAINKLSTKRVDSKKIMISNQVHTDKVVINLFLAGTAFNASELEFHQNQQGISADVVDMNMILMREMAIETNTNWAIENKTDRSGNISGMLIRFSVPRAIKENRSKNLISVMKGKKRDLARELMN
jgi:hypothetical protein